MSDRKCARGCFAPAEFDRGPLLGLCLGCIENDHTGLLAEVAVLRKENADLKARAEEALHDWNWVDSK